MIFDTMIEPETGQYLSEDYAASVRMSLCDVKHFSMKPKKQLNHWGEYPFSFAPYAG